MKHLSYPSSVPAPEWPLAHDLTNKKMQGEIHTVELTPYSVYIGTLGLKN